MLIIYLSEKQLNIKVDVDNIFSFDTIKTIFNNMGVNDDEFMNLDITYGGREVRDSNTYLVIEGLILIVKCKNDMLLQKLEYLFLDYSPKKKPEIYIMNKEQIKQINKNNMLLYNSEEFKHLLNIYINKKNIFDKFIIVMNSGQIKIEN